MQLNIMDALVKLNDLVDESDPDVDVREWILNL